MANYNTFVVVDCKSRKITLVTSSAKKANALFEKGIRIEVWNGNRCIEKIYDHDRKRELFPLAPYIEAEKEYIQKKQVVAEKRNKIRRNKR